MCINKIINPYIHSKTIQILFFIIYYLFILYFKKSTQNVFVNRTTARAQNLCSHKFQELTLF